MKRAIQAVAAAAMLVTAQAARATPSTVFWTPATSYTQPYLVPHFTYDTYVAERGNLLNDYGLTVGVIPGEKVLGEIGVDVFLPKAFLKNTFQLNGKVTLAEGAYGKWQPGVSLGVMGVGFEKNISDQNLLYLATSKTTGPGTFGAGVYYGAGSKLLWTGSDGKVNRTGLMVSYVSPDWVLNLPGLNKLNFTADIATGKNAFGAGGFGAVVYFTPNIDLITGPVWFLDSNLSKAVNGTDFMWTFQVDVDFDLIKKPPETKP
jgi:hypothetical protein